MSKKTWQMLTVIFAGAGMLMLIAGYLPNALMLGENTISIKGDRADGYVQDGTPAPSGISYLYVIRSYSNIGLAGSFLYFDTSNIPSGATIDEVKLKIYLYSKGGNGLTMFYYDSNGVYPHKPYRSSDVQSSNYNNIIASKIFSSTGWKNIILPTSIINRNGFTKFAILPQPHSHMSCVFASADYSSYAPKLIITYSTPDKYHLTVKTNPTYADVTVAGQTKNSGTSGATFYLTEGSYKVTVSKDGYKTKSTTVYLSRDKTITVTLEPEVHEYTLTVHTSPTYCTVEVMDGDTWTADSGASGKCTFTLEEDQYYVTVSKDGYEAQTKTVTLNSNKDVYFTLEPEIHEYTLTIYVNPVGATVEVGGQTKIVPQTGFVDFTLEEGTYTVTVYKDGYSTVNRQINLNQNTELHISLTPQRPDVAITHYMSVIGVSMLLLAIPCGVKGYL